ncbi:transcription factor HES-4-B-like [Tubulanus polymorphus]|uniref:transcription factor HES-4-B-like n=1 Tax=Tubulanus polymorphus TaxID=672921 RepID=UPI003DA5CE43
MTRPEIASPPRKANDRRIMKPLIEKKRRSRINSSLNELKTLLEVVIGKQIPRDYKLEKADILELTVSHLKSNISQLQRAMNPNDINKYQIGFSECVSEVSNYLMTIDGADPELRPRVLEHLSNRIGNMAQPSTSSGEPRNRMTAIAAPLAMPAKRCPVEVIHQQAVTENVWRPW